MISNKRQNIEDTFFDLAKAILSFENILSQIEIAKMATQANTKNNN